MSVLTFDVRGIPVEVNESTFDDFRFLMLLARLGDDTDVMALPPLADMLFGREQFGRILKQLEDEGGVCKTSDVTPFIFDTITEAAKAKNAGEGKN